MIGFLAANIGTIIIALILIAVVTLIILKMKNDKKSGRSSCGCGCGCGGCPNSALCHSNNDASHQESVQTHSVQKQCVRIAIETITGAADSSARSVPTPASRSALIYESVSGAFRVEQLPYNSLKVKKSKLYRSDLQIILINLCCGRSFFLLVKF